MSKNILGTQRPKLTPCAQILNKSHEIFCSGPLLEKWQLMASTETSKLGYFWLLFQGGVVCSILFCLPTLEDAIQPIQGVSVFQVASR